LVAEDSAAAWRLSSVAFGYADRPMPADWSPEAPGRVHWGVFDEAGRLAAKALDREQGHWYGGRIVPASGVAGVAVAPECRGAGLVRTVLTPLLAHARERGAAISTLFDTTPFPYRRLGWEEVGALTYIALPTTALTVVRAPKDVTLRPATESDVPVLQELYRSVARAGAGLLERSGPMFTGTPQELLAAFQGLTLAVAASGTVEGYATWDRSSGYDGGGKLTVYDLVGVSPDATAALLAMLGSWTSVAPTVVLRLSPGDPALLQLSSAGATIQSVNPWMLRVVDVAGAVAARGWPARLSGAIDITLVDEVCPWNAGERRLVLDAGEGHIEAGGKGDVVLTERGLALLYAGAASTAVVRRAGLLTGGDPTTDAFLDAAFAGPRPALLDYF
jgi:predicted acetyltransferase